MKNRMSMSFPERRIRVRLGTSVLFLFAFSVTSYKETVSLPQRRTRVRLGNSVLCLVAAPSQHPGLHPKTSKVALLTSHENKAKRFYTRARTVAAVLHACH